MVRVNVGLLKFCARNLTTNFADRFAVVIGRGSVGHDRSLINK